MLKNKKLYIHIIFFTILILLCILIFISCKYDTKEPDISSDINDDTSAKIDNEACVLMKNDEFLYTIVYSSNATSREFDCSKSLFFAIQNTCGVIPDFESDLYHSNNYDKEKLEILIGRTKYNESEAVFNSIGYGSYSIIKTGNKIVITSLSEAGLIKAVDTFISSIKNNYKDNKIVLPADFQKSVVVNKSLEEIPRLGDVQKAVVYNIDYGHTDLIVLPSSNVSDYNNYLSSLENKGYQLYVKNKIGENYFSTYKKSTDVLNVSFYKNTSEMRIVIESSEDIYLPPLINNYKSVCDTELNVLGVSLDVYENGMSMFFRLADGRFIIYDGGRNTADAKNIMNYLRSSSNQAGQSKITIAAWIITHSHGDHAGAYIAFINNFVSEVTIERLIYNSTNNKMGVAAKEGMTMEEMLLTVTITKSSKTEIISARTGQVFNFADIKIEILFTMDAYVPETFDDYNAASIVSMVTVAGKKILVTGDATPKSMDKLSYLYGEYLKSDYLQVPHHGAIGITINSFKIINPQILIWPAGPSLYSMVNTPGYISYAANKYMIENTNKIYIAGSVGTLTVIKF